MNTTSAIMALIVVGLTMFLINQWLTAEQQREEALKNDPEYQKKIAAEKAAREKAERDKANGYTVLASNATMQIIEVTAMHGYKQVDYMLNNGWVLAGSNILGGDYYLEQRTCHGSIMVGKVVVPTTYSCDRDNHTPLTDRFVFVKAQ